MLKLLLNFKRLNVLFFLRIHLQNELLDLDYLLATNQTIYQIKLRYWLVLNSNPKNANAHK